MGISDWIAIGALVVSGIAAWFSKKALNENKRANDIAEKLLEVSSKEHQRNLENDQKTEEKDLEVSLSFFVKPSPFGNKAQFQYSINVRLYNKSIRKLIEVKTVKILIQNKVNSECLPVSTKGRGIFPTALSKIQPGEQKTGRIDFSVNFGDLSNSERGNWCFYSEITDIENKTFHSGFIDTI